MPARRHRAEPQDERGASPFRHVEESHHAVNGAIATEDSRSSRFLVAGGERLLHGLHVRLPDGPRAASSGLRAPLNGWSDGDATPAG